MMGTALTASLIAGAYVAMPATAGPKPTPTLTIPNNHVTANKPFNVRYSSSHVPRGSTLFLQRQFGSAHVWKNVKRLAGTHGATSAPGVQMGEYGYRVAISKPHKASIYSRGRNVFVYGNIPFTTLCSARNVQWGNFDNGCQSGSAQVGNYLFQAAATFSAEGSYNASAPNVNLAVAPSTSCRALHLDYGESNYDNQFAGGNMMITQIVVQAHSDPVSVTFPGGTLQHTDVALDGGPFQITDESSYTGAGSLSVLVNGSLNCFTSNGVR